MFESLGLYKDCVATRNVPLIEGKNYINNQSQNKDAMPSLQDYIQEELKKGYSREEITQTLLKYKYPQEAIDKAFEKTTLDTEIKKRESRFNYGEIVFVVLAIVLLTFGGLYYFVGKEFQIKKTKTQPIQEFITPTSQSNEEENIACVLAQDKDTCFTRLAIKYNDPKRCKANSACLAYMAIQLNNVDICTTDTCIITLAHKNNDRKICAKTKRIIDCELSFESTLNDKLEIIRKMRNSIPPADWAVYAFELNTSEVCTIAPNTLFEGLDLKESTTQNVCKIRWAVKNKDSEVCNGLTTSEDIQLCLRLVDNRCKEDNSKMCYYIGER